MVRRLKSKPSRDDIPPEYIDAVKRLLAWLLDWDRNHPGARLAFRWPPPEVIVTGLLSEMPEGMIGNEETAQLVAEARAEFPAATIFMLQVAAGYLPPPRVSS